MPTILEMATEIVKAHASTTSMTKEELIQEIGDLHNALAALEKGEAVAAGSPTEEEEAAPVVSMRKAFGKKQVFCMICGKGMKTLGRHLKSAHDITPKEYRAQFGIPRTQALAAKDYSETRKQMAIDRGLGENLAKVRAGKEKRRKGPANKKTAKTESAPTATEE